MIFQQHRQVLTGQKTETRRCVQPGEVALYRDEQIYKVLTAKGRQKWLVGNEMPVIPKRSMCQLGRINLHAIRQEPLHAITEAGAIAEGVTSIAEYRELWQSINGEYPGRRWEDNPTVWVLKFSAKSPVIQPLLL